jgi:hypothetical protein
MQEAEAKATEEAPVQATPEAVALALKRSKFAMQCRVGFAKRALSAGRAAKFAHFARISPYYENPELDHFFFAGFDGQSWEEAVKDMKE